MASWRLPALRLHAVVAESVKASGRRRRQVKCAGQMLTRLASGSELNVLLGRVDLLNRCWLLTTDFELGTNSTEMLRVLAAAQDGRRTGRRREMAQQNVTALNSTS